MTYTHKMRVLDTVNAYVDRYGEDGCLEVAEKQLIAAIKNGYTDLGYLFADVVDYIKDALNE